MSYAPSSQINIDDKPAKILDKHLRSNVSVIRRMLREIRDFGITHHPLFKRFKHAGVPIMCGNIRSSNLGFLSDFEFCNMISVGIHPFSDIIPIPYSKEALDSYTIIIHGLQCILNDMVENRIICIQRKLTGLIPKQRYDITSLSSDEATSMKQIVEDFYAKHPAKQITISTNYNLNIKEEKIPWYLNIHEFLDQCKKRKDIEDKYNKNHHN